MVDGEEQKERAPCSSSHYRLPAADEGRTVFPSSPRKRGYRPLPFSLIPANTVIPAQAGISFGVTSVKDLSSCHPRASGNLLLRSYLPLSLRLSSPRKRGSPLEPCLRPLPTLCGLESTADYYYLTRLLSGLHPPAPAQSITCIRARDYGSREMNFIRRRNASIIRTAARLSIRAGTGERFLPAKKGPLYLRIAEPDIADAPNIPLSVRL